MSTDLTSAEQRLINDLRTLNATDEHLSMLGGFFACGVTAAQADIVCQIVAAGRISSGDLRRLQERGITTCLTPQTGREDTP